MKKAILFAVCTIVGYLAVRATWVSVNPSPPASPHLTSKERFSRFSHWDYQTHPMEEVQGSSGETFWLPPLGRVYLCDDQGKVVKVKILPPDEAINERSKQLEQAEAKLHDRKSLHK